MCGLVYPPYPTPPVDGCHAEQNFIPESGVIRPRSRTSPSRSGGLLPRSYLAPVTPALGPTDVVLFGVRLQEIDVILTDLLWSGVSLACFILLTRVRRTLSAPGQWFRWMFLLLAVAVFLGAFLGHGFQYAVGYEGKYPGWIISMWSVACFERSSILYAGERVSERLARVMSVANVIELLLFHALILFSQPLLDRWAVEFDAFYFVEIHAAYGLIAIAFPLHFLIWRQTRDTASGYVLVGIAVAASAVVVHLTGFYLHPVWFNYHDVSHVILTVSSVLYYQAARRMRLSPKPAGRRGGIAYA